MYADRVESGTKRSIRDRLNGNLDEDFIRSRQSSGKRQCHSDDKWKHDLYMDKRGSQISEARVGAEDLRAKLQKKSMQQSYQGGRESGVRDLSGKPTGKLPVPLKAKLVPEPPAPSKAKRIPEPPAPLKAKRIPEPPALPKAKPVPEPPAQLKSKSVPESAKPVQKHVPPVEEMVPDTKKVPASTSSLKKSRKKSGSSVDGLLKSLGLEKYSLTFQAEEVDMAALRYMTEDDLRTLGIPMGPRKKILLALDAKA